MCGIAGVLGREPRAGRGAAVAGMLERLVHRGPDGEGVLERRRCAIGLRRLSIMDVAAPSAPFSSEDGSVFSVCNGQIYNSDELRRDLEARGHRFRTRVDTEVLVHLWEEHGPDLVERLSGMFAFAVWDERSETLLLGRDRAGEKPLFFREDPDGLIFASEIQGILAHPGVAASVDPEALQRFLVHGFVAGERSLVAGIRKLPAGHLLLHRGGRTRVSRYWDLAEYFLPREALDRRTIDDIVEGLDERMSRAVARRSRSDVPFGVFLSGGLDSATLLAYVRERHGPGVPAFTIGHRDRDFDESSAAAETARFLQADLHTLVLDRDELAEGLAAVGEGFDEPLGDASIIPTFLLARLAREQVKVVLSGEGADELFAGYPTYLGHRVADALGWVPAGVWRAASGAVSRLLPSGMGNVSLGYLAERFLSGLGRDPEARHWTWFGGIDPRLLPGLLSPRLDGDRLGESEVFARIGAGLSLPDRLSERLYLDFTTYLQDDLLTKVDRAGMLASLESRAPYLDHELAQYVAGIPSSWKVRGWTTKAVLRRLARGRIPEAVLSRRKRGFNIPFSRWILDGLGDDLQRRFSRERVEARGLLRWEGVDRLLSEHLARRADHRKPIFALLALDLWCDRTFGEVAPVPLGAPAIAVAERVPAGSPA